MARGAVDDDERADANAYADSEPRSTPGAPSRYALALAEGVRNYTEPDPSGAAGSTSGATPQQLVAALSDSDDFPGPLDPAAAKMSCVDAYSACRRAGRDYDTCWRAFSKCGKGMDTIFAPGIWGSPHN
jgi:hypothetical protein